MSPTFDAAAPIPYKAAMPTIVACPYCGQQCQLPLCSGLPLSQCPQCAKQFWSPGPEQGLFTDPATEGLLTAVAISTTCPYCGQVAKFRSRGSRKCNHCGEWIYLRNGFPRSRKEANKIDSKREAKEKRERLKYFRQRAMEWMQTWPAVADAFPRVRVSAIGDDRCCAFCHSQDNRLIAFQGCTLEMLPPFKQCSNKEDGCRCAFIAESASGK
jgi:hypothetical protein